MLLSFAMVLLGITTMLTLSLSGSSEDVSDGSRREGRKARKWIFIACIGAMCFGVINGFRLGGIASPEYLTQKLEASNDPACLQTHLKEKARKSPLSREQVRVAISICRTGGSKTEKPLRLQQLDVLKNFTPKEHQQ